MPEAILRLEGLTKRYGPIVPVDHLTLTIYRGEFFTFLGPSGAGKSTILRLIAGLEQPDAGHIRFGDKDMAGVAPWHRNLGMVFQQYALFPHMNVAQNVGYGLRVRKAPRHGIHKRVGELLALVGLEGRETTDVAVLSGGEQQRVALARALALNPPLLLLDEPLGALDEKIRRDMQTELKGIQQKTGTTFVYVTHDQEEALTMSDRIAVMHRGGVVQCDTPEAVFRRPRTRFVAGFFRGCNILEAHVLQAGSGWAQLRISDISVRVPMQGATLLAGATVPLGLRSENVRVGRSAQQCALRGESELLDVIYRGLTTDYLLHLQDGQRLTATSTHRADDVTGTTVPFGFNPDDLLVLDDDE
jgi:ABC-type Fe3+/spermidine/putrescine transport system ATPase subunit